MEASLKLGYLDDVNLGGTVKTVASDVAEIIRSGSEIGLSLNVSKCELIAHKLMTPCRSHSTGWNLKMPSYWDRLCFPVLHFTRRGMIGVRTSPEPLTD